MDNHDNGNYPLVNIQKAIEAMAIGIVSFPINSMVILQFVCKQTFTRGIIWLCEEITSGKLT